MSLDQMASYSSPEPPNLKLSKGPQRVSSIPAYPDNRNQSNSNVQESHEDRKHFAWLKKQFEQCFGLSTDSYKRRPIYNFDGVKIAEGFNKVVATWQGLYFELKGEDILFENLDRDLNTARGIITYSTKGVQIIKPHREDVRTTPRPHRFAVIPRGNPTQPCNPLQVGKFYVHVYQTKLLMAGNFMKTLNSKSIARTLRQMYGMRYIPRPRDLPHEHHPNEDIEGQNMNPPVYNQFTQWAQPQQKIQWNQNPHQSKLNKIQNTRIHEVSPNTNQNYLSWQYPKETNAAYHQARSQDRRRSKEQTVNANFFPLAQNPPPFPFNSQNNNLSTINPNIAPNLNIIYLCPLQLTNTSRCNISSTSGSLIKDPITSSG